MAPHGVGDLDGGGPDAAAGGVHQDTLARCEPALGEQGIMSRDKRLGDRRGLHKARLGGIGTAIRSCVRTYSA